MQFKVYGYHPRTGELTGETDADESPLEPGVPLLPALTTAVLPPVLANNEAAIFDEAGGIWSVVPDFRGRIFFDQTTGAAVVIELLGALPANLGEAVPPAVLLEHCRCSKTAYINECCSAAILGGFTSNALGAEHHYTATLEDQINLLALVANGTGGEYTCTDSAGLKARKFHSVADLQVLLADGEAFKDQCLARARLLKDAVAQAADPAAVEAINWD